MFELTTIWVDHILVLVQIENYDCFDGTNNHRLII